MLLIVRYASVYPLAVGVKVTGICTLAPGFTVTGTGKEPIAKPLPETDFELMRRAFEPVFISWMESEAEVPICTLPKACMHGSQCICCAHNDAGAMTSAQSSHAIGELGKNRMRL